MLYYRKESTKGVTMCDMTNLRDSKDASWMQEMLLGFSDMLLCVTRSISWVVRMQEMWLI